MVYMTPVKDLQDFNSRLQRLRSKYKKRDSMVKLCNEMYFMERTRKSGFFGIGSGSWREKVADEYWESSNKAQNVIDVMTAVLSGHPPQFHCLVPGNVESTIPSRAETFLDGVLRLNSRRQQSDLVRDIVFNTVRDGACGIRAYWMPKPPQVRTEVVPGLEPSPITDEEAEEPVPSPTPQLGSMPTGPQLDMGGTLGPRIPAAGPAPGIEQMGPMPGVEEGVPPGAISSMSPTPPIAPQRPMPSMPGSRAEYGGPMQPPLPGEQPPPQEENQVRVPDPDNPQAPPWVVQMHNHETFPICIEVIEIEKLYPGGRGPHGKPFSEIFYVQKRTPGDVLDEWGEELDNTDKVTEGLPPSELDNSEFEYVEWWGQARDGTVWYSITYRDQWIVEPTQTKYPALPFVITSFKKVSPPKGDGMERMPFLYSIFYAMDKLEYVRSRFFRMLDMYANMNPYHSGENPISGVDATWGKVIEMQPKEDIKFPPWPGTPPDMHREMSMISSEISEGSFSEAMFGQVSTRTSGYALSQVIGADTLRTDTPRGNLELAFSTLADRVFGLMQVFSPKIHLAVTSQIRHRRLATMLSGDETKVLVVETFIKPKQTNDEVRLATLGAQIASLPNPPVSVRYILEHYFGVNQPEEEIDRKLDEETMREPIIRMMALIDVLREQKSPYTPILEGQLQQAMAASMQPPGAGNGVGGGLPQAVGGNQPIIPGSGNPSEEAPTPGSVIQGGPR